MFTENNILKQMQQYLLVQNRINDENLPLEKEITFKYITIRYDEYIPSKVSKTTIVIFHGVGGNGRLHSFIAVPLVKAGFNVICPDLPGYGYTQIHKIFDYSTWIDAGSFIVNREIDTGNDVFVFGLSPGGMLAYIVTCKVKKDKGLMITNILDNRLQIVRDYSANNKFHSRFGIKFLSFLLSFIKGIKVPVKMVANMKAIVNSNEVLKLLLFVHPEIDEWNPFEISRLFFDKIQTAKKVVILKNAGHFPIELPGLNQLEVACIDFIVKGLVLIQAASEMAIEYCGYAFASPKLASGQLRIFGKRYE